MPRFRRIVAPGLPHHVTLRGNRREPIFFEPGDQSLYRRILSDEAHKSGVDVWAYCLMPNHVHLIMVPSDDAGLGACMGKAHRRYTGFVNQRAGWTGTLFQGRYASVVMDEAHLMAAARYVALNPVRAGLVDHAEDWPWSSVRAHLSGLDDGLVTVRPLLDRIPDMPELLMVHPEQDRRFGAAFRALRAAEPPAARSAPKPLSIGCSGSQGTGNLVPVETRKPVPASGDWPSGSSFRNQIACPRSVLGFAKLWPPRATRPEP